jgi:hypothetical protein
MILFRCFISSNYLYVEMCDVLEDCHAQICCTIHLFLRTLSTQAAGTIAARWQRQYDVDLRRNVTIMALNGDTDGRLRRARLSDDDVLDIDVAVVALGAVRKARTKCYCIVFCGCACIC